MRSSHRACRDTPSLTNCRLGFRLPDRFCVWGRSEAMRCTLTSWCIFLQIRFARRVRSRCVGATFNTHALFLRWITRTLIVWTRREIVAHFRKSASYTSCRSGASDDASLSPILIIPESNVEALLLYSAYASCIIIVHKHLFVQKLCTFNFKLC